MPSDLEGQRRAYDLMELELQTILSHHRGIGNCLSLQEVQEVVLITELLLQPINIFIAFIYSICVP